MLMKKLSFPNLPGLFHGKGNEGGNSFCFFLGGEVGEAEDQQLEHCIGKEEGTLSDLDAPRNEGNILEADWISKSSHLRCPCPPSKVGVGKKDKIQRKDKGWTDGHCFLYLFWGAGEIDFVFQSFQPWFK